MKDNEGSILRKDMAQSIWKVIYKNKVNQRILNSETCYKLPMHFYFHDKHETVILNSKEQSYNRLMRDCLIWFGETNILNLNKIPKRIVCIKNYKQLQSFYLKRQNYLENMYIFSWESQNAHQQTKILQKCVKIQHYPLNELINSLQQYICNKVDVISQNRINYMFPNLSQISKEDNKKLNCERFWMYSVISGIDYKKSFEDFYDFFEYFYKNENNSNKTNMRQIFKELKQQSKNIGSNPKKYLKMYTSENKFYVFINLCLRSWTDSRDLGHIRYPFLQLFIAVHMLFTQQRVDRPIKDQQIQKMSEYMKKIIDFRKKGFICYRGTGMKKEQILAIRQNSYIQLTGLCSFSLNENLVKLFLKFWPVVLKINVPPINKPINVCHSFAFVSQISTFASEQEVVFSPLNMFKVQKITLQKSLQSQNQKIQQKIDIKDENKILIKRQKQENMKNKIITLQMHQNQQFAEDSDEQTEDTSSYYEYTEIQLTYINGQAIKSSEQKDSQLFVKNYGYQRQMYVMNRNDGQLLWRNGDLEDALNYYLIQIRKFIQIQKKNINNKQRAQTFMKNKYLKQFLDPSMVKRLLKQLQEILRGFQWFETQKQNLQLIKNFLVNHIHRNHIFYIARIYSGYLNYERAAIFLEVYFLQMLTMYNRKAAGLYLAATNLSINLSRLDEYESSQIFMKNALKYGEKNKIKVGKSNFAFLAIHLINCHQTNKLGDIQVYKKIIKQIMMRQNKQPMQEDRAWVEFINNLGNIKKIYQFKIHCNKHFGRPPVFLKLVCCYELQMSLFKAEEYTFKLQSSTLSQEIKQELKTAEQCINSFGHQQDQQQFDVLKNLLILSCQIILKGLDYNRLNKISSIVQSWIDNNIADKNTYYYKLRTHIVCLRFIFKMCQKLDNFDIQKYMNHLCQLHIFIEQKFKNREYLRMLYLLSICQFFLACYHVQKLSCYKKQGEYFLSILTCFSKKMRTITTLDRMQIQLMQQKMNRSFYK